ncbi:uncharacterized protein ACN63O_008790 [Diretmus argenteus]
MDSWTLQGDSYSFLRSAPHTFSLHHRDGTPNHVEIFDITNIPSHRSAISETTCLCDIFGDDCESPSLSSSPASGSFVPSQRELDGRSAASPLVDDLNNSSGSYHTAQGSSEGEEGFEDSTERFHSPTLQSENSERRLSEGQVLSSEDPGVSKDIKPALEPKSKLPIPQLSTASPSAEVVNFSCSNRTPSPGYNSPHTLSPEGRVSSLSSSSVDTRSSLSSPSLTQTQLAAESRSITPTSRNRHSSSSHQSSTQSPSPEPESGAQLSSESGNTSYNHDSSPSPEPTPGSFSPDLTSAFEPRVILSSHSPSLSSTGLSSQSRETLSPELKNRSYTPDTQLSSPFPELRGRVSLPDLLSRGSTPDIEDSPCTPELVSYSSAGSDITRTPENQDNKLSAEPGSTVSTPAPRYTPPSPVVSLVPTPELRENSVSPEGRCAAPSPRLLSTASPNCRHTAASPEIRITTSSPEVGRRAQSSEVELTSNSLDLHFDSTSSHSRSPTSSPHIGGICYSVVQPEDRDTTPFPDLSRLSPPEPGRTHLSPKPRSPTPSRDSIQSSITESTSTPRGSPHITGFTCFTVLQPENTETTLSPQHRYQTPSPESKFHTPSPEPGNQTLSSETCQTPSPQPRNRTPSPVAPSSEPCHLWQQQSPVAPSPEVDLQYTQPTLPLRDTPVVEGVSSSLDITGIQYPSHLANDKVSASSELDKSNSSLKSTAKSNRQLSPKVGSETRERFMEDMAHHVRRKRTPSPPLTRFTPVHIIAPEKPYRQWQNRGCSPPQAVSPSLTGKLKKQMTDTESPNVAPNDSNSQAYWVRLERELEMEKEKEMQLEEERERARERDRKRQREREMERERKKEERVPDHREGWQGDASYRGEQVELSFSARNRKGPVTRSAAPTGRETRQRMPTARSYSETVLATRQLQQQQSLFRAHTSHQDTKGGGPTRRLHPAVPQNKNTAPGRVTTSRPRQSSSSSMGSELDEADNEVKWFSDLAFHSLSNPEVDYLDMYNSSHRSSTNISQPSTQESPAGANAAWLAYAEFRGSAPRLDNEDFSYKQSSNYFSDGLNTSKRYEMGSFECVDVAVEREESRKGKRGVPKRQIQLKRKNTADGKQDESSGNSSPVVPVTVDSPSLQRHSRETLVRQHSTPAAMQESYHPEPSPEPGEKNERKSKLQKSASLDETCTKTKMATCLIKSVLSKKMQSVDKQTEENVTEEEATPPSEDKTPPPESAEAPLKESPRPDTHNLSASLHSDHSLSSEDLAVRREPSTNDQFGRQKKGAKSSRSPTANSSNTRFTSPQTDSERTDSQSRNTTSTRSEMRSELMVPFDSKQSTTENVIPRAGRKQADGSKSWEEREGSDLANATAGKTRALFATGASSTQASMTNRDQECESVGTEDHKQLQQSNKSTYMSKTPEMTLKSSPAMEKKKTSLNVSLTPEVENKPELRCEAPSPEKSFGEKEERVDARAEDKIEEEEGNGNNKVKVPIHKVRDVRRLVKNTYNLSFKASSALQTSPQSKGKPLSRSQPMQIECKAVCWKEDKNKMTPSKIDPEKPGDKHLAPPQHTHETDRESESSSCAKTQGYTTRDTVAAKPCQPDTNMAAETQDTGTETYKVPDSEDKPVVVRRDKKPPMLGSLPKLPSKDREVSTAVVVIRDGPSKTKAAASPAQEEIPTPVQAPSTSPSPVTTPGSSSHSVSMFLKEKGYQADIGAVVGEGQSAAGGKGVPRKHVNRLEIPLQTSTPSDGGLSESQRERTFSSSSTKSGPTAVSDNTESLIKNREEDGVSIKPTVRDAAKQNSVSPLRNTQQQTLTQIKQKEQGDLEAVKRPDPTFPPRSPALRRFRSQPIEVKSLSKETQKQDMPANNVPSNRPQAIEVRSISNNSQKPVVPPKPNYKFKPTDLGPLSNETQKPAETTSSVKPQGEEKPQTIVVSSPTIYRKLSNETTSTSNYTRKLAVSAVSSYKPPPSKTAATTISSLSNQSTAPPEIEASNDRAQQQHPRASPQSSRYTQRPTTLATASTSAKGPCLTSAPGPIPDLTANQVPGPASAVSSQASQTTFRELNSQPQYPRTAYPQERAMPMTSSNIKQPAAVSITQAPGYTHPHQPYHRSLSNERSQRTDDLRFYASDDPPSYDERESFSPLMLPDLTHRRPSRYQPSSRPPPCSCTSGCHAHPGLNHPHHHHSPHNLTPPAPPHSPGQALPYPVAQPPLRPHQCRPDPQPMSYQPSSPKSSPLSPSQPVMYQPLHQPPACPPHPSHMQPCPADRPLQPMQHIDPRRPPVHRSPQQQPPGVGGGHYNEPGHSHSPSLPPMDPQYLCGPQNLGPSYGSEYGGDGSSLYSESNYGQTPRRVLMDPETGKYFYIEVPVQPLRKMLFDPETGQYVEVLIPQQAMSHSGLYPPSAAPYPSLHNPNMYAPAPQYLPYAAPPPPPHSQAQPLSPRHPEASSSATMHQNGAAVNYGSPSGQGSKPEPQNHPPLDQSYLEGMYYVPTGMNASPNPTPPDCYHKHPPNLPTTGGKRS